jgi:hypothetical protein
MPTLSKIFNLVFVVPFLWRPSGKHLLWYFGIFIVVCIVATVTYHVTDDPSHLAPLLAGLLAFTVALKYYFYAIRPKERTKSD